MRIWTNAKLATLSAARSDLGAIEGGAIVEDSGRIVFAGPASDAPTVTNAETVDCEGRWITPGFIDCHTHLVYAGSRAREFEMRLQGATYEEIAESGGGIRSTMLATRKASEEQLVEDALPRLDALLAEGVTTIEIKSGYGLDVEHELKQLRAARTLGERRDVEIRTTLLAAHTLPPEFDGRPDDFIDLVCNQIIPEAASAGLVDAVDAFCESIGFTREQTERVFEAARSAGLPVKLHAEQLSNSHGAQLAAKYGALSADHLEYLDEDGVRAMAQAGTAAVILPGAFYFLRDTKLPPFDLLRKHRVPMAIATDCNPGTSPLTSVLLAMNMAATLFRLTVKECLKGVTCNAAAALGMAHKVGSLEVGKQCDLAIWDIESPAELVYNIGLNKLHQRVRGGR
ncbi:imidazolonepropionase [Henriciella sp. AS95]|uniref:imidazolonepropionase n=1 Tax=Henriciella sp. AS95 TaxID=3135782 RepID=UPI00317105B1